jgi:hypothetical protein
VHHCQRRNACLDGFSALWVSLVASATTATISQNKMIASSGQAERVPGKRAPGE